MNAHETEMLDDNGGRPDITFLTTLPNEPEAQMAADTLRSQGVPVLLRPGGPGVGAWASASTFEHDIFVRTHDLGEARRILESFNGEDSGRAVPRRTTVPTKRAVRKGSRRPR